MGKKVQEWGVFPFEGFLWAIVVKYEPARRIPERRLDFGQLLNLPYCEWFSPRNASGPAVSEVRRSTHQTMLAKYLAAYLAGSQQPYQIIFGNFRQLLFRGTPLRAKFDLSQDHAGFITHYTGRIVNYLARCWKRQEWEVKSDPLTAFSRCLDQQCLFCFGPCHRSEFFDLGCLRRW